MTLRFRLDSPLGMGPHGPVHRAIPERLGADPVAVRRLHVPSGPRRHRLRGDAEAVALLGHPGLAAVHDIVEVDDETVLVASTLGTGGNLADRLLLGPLPVDEAVSLVRTVAEAMASAHALGITHGRLSTTNVVFTDDGPVVTDLVASGAVHDAGPGDEAVADDTADVVRLAATLVDPTDRSPRATAYRALCRWASESDADLVGLVAALDRLPRLEALCPTDGGLTVSAKFPAPGSAGRAGRGRAAVALLVGASLFVGAVVGFASTLLPAGG